MILERLREETRAEHERVERTVDVMRARGWTKPQVGKLVEGFWGFYEPWEREAGVRLGREGMGGWFEERRKLGALERDVAFYRGASTDELSLDRCDRMPDTTTIENALGSMYVLEGSTLGGQIIARHFRQNVPGLEGGQGCSFFLSYGDRVGTMWREFQGVLTQRASSASVEDAMIAAARQTFELLRVWLHEAVR